MKLEILGTGCPKCKRLYERVQKAVNESGITAEVVKVDKMEDIIAYGVMKTPALAVDGEIVVVGRVPSLKELQSIIKL